MLGRTADIGVHGAWLDFIRHSTPGWTPYDTGTRTAAVIDEQWSAVGLPAPR
ncbi:hypothetical protein ABTY61_19570 [Kitasatospora sp. NPDC096128]|uniref:hypothetical protein n=1 Tax=Kitasatospora sp. NPDC096128 TaxID=3155547 RepID=UPI00332E6770